MPGNPQPNTLLLREHQLPPEGIRVSDTTLICTQDHSSITHFLDSRFFKRESLLESLFKEWTGWCLEAQVPGAQKRRYLVPKSAGHSFLNNAFTLGDFPPCPLTKISPAFRNSSMASYLA
jgi:hypothetical protein